LAYLCGFYSDTESKSLATLQILLKKLLSIGGSYLSEEIHLERAEFDGNELDSGDRLSDKEKVLLGACRVGSAN
jgi:hypothetical protein